MSEIKALFIAGRAGLFAADEVSGEYLDGELVNGEQYIITITKATPEKARTAKQRAAIEVYCRLCAAKCLEGGLDLRVVIAKIKESTEIPVTQPLFKDIVFKGIQMAMIAKESTTKLSTAEVSDVYMVVNRFTSERLGFSIPWPSNRSD